MKRNKNFDSRPLLYLISTPIGNLEEFSLRAKRIISEADIVVCEDTRVSGKLLSIFDIKPKQLISLEKHNELIKSVQLIDLILKEEKKVVYMSDAGYPAISDPGQILVKQCLDNNINVSVVSGPCALINALSCSGLDSTHFLFYGFLNAKESARIKQLQELKNLPFTLIFYEAPHRISKTISDINLVLGNREMVIARELTKINEEFIFGTAQELTTIDESTLKGEMVIVVEGFNKQEKEIQINEEQIIFQLKDCLKRKMSKKDAINHVSNTLNINKKIVYKLMNNLK